MMNKTTIAGTVSLCLGSLSTFGVALMMQYGQLAHAALGSMPAAATTPLCAAEVDTVATLQVDAVLIEKADAEDAKSLERLSDAVAAAKSNGDAAAVASAERALAKHEARLLAKRQRVILGRTLEEEFYQPGGTGPVSSQWRQRSCAVLVTRDASRADELKPGTFISLTRIDSRSEKEEGGVRRRLRESFDAPYFDDVHEAVHATAWKLTDTPSKWPVEVCETPWAKPSAELTLEAKLEVKVLPEKLVYEYRDFVRYILKIRNGGDKPIKSANIWFVFRDEKDEVVHVQRYWTNDRGLTIVEPRITNLAPGEVFTIQTFATKSVDIQTKAIDVVVLSLTR